MAAASSTVDRTVDMDATERLQARAVEGDVPADQTAESRTVALLPTAVREGAGVVGVTGGEGVAEGDALLVPLAAHRMSRHSLRLAVRGLTMVVMLVRGPM